MTTIPESAPPNDPQAGLWRQNWPLVQLLGLTPLLAITTSALQGLALGLATLVALAIGAVTAAALGPFVLASMRAGLFLLVTALVVTCLDVLTHAVFFELHAALGIFLPLIVANGGLQAEAHRAPPHRSVGGALLHSLHTGGGYLAVLVALGALRELVGRGTLFGDAALLGGARLEWLALRLPFDGALVAALPPGAFFGVAALLALRYRLAKRTEPVAP